MTRDEALLKLVAVEPDTRDNILRATGWPAQEAREVFDRLLRERRIGYTEWTGRRGFVGRRLCVRGRVQ
jgi:hypothetical protein